MNAIVMNTLGGAVTEFTGFDFQSITPTQAGSALGLYQLGGELDVIAPVVARIKTGATAWGDSRRKHIGLVFFSMQSSGTHAFSVVTPDATYSYDFPARADGVSRTKPGRGIRENYLAFGYSNSAGQDFRLDGFEVTVDQPLTRRTA